MSIPFFGLILLLLCISFQANCHPMDQKLQLPIKDALSKLECNTAAECMELEGPKWRKLKLSRKVSWRVPDHNNVKEKNPGFSSDYEHARTHPPSHN